MKFWGSDDLPVPRRRWIGVCVSELLHRVDYDEAGHPFHRHDAGGLNDHCLVMCHERLIFDPSCSVLVPPGTQLWGYYPDDIDYGISFDKEE